MSKLKQLRAELSPNDTKSKEQLDFVLDSAKSKLELFRVKFLERFNNPQAFKSEILPVKMFDFIEEYRADISEGSSGEVDAIIDDFFKGTGQSVKTGFNKVIKLAFRSLLGDSSIGESYVNRWFITVEYGELIRVDLMAWKYNFSSNQVIENIQNVYCCTITKSFIDNDSLRKSQLNYFLAQSLGLTSLDEIINNEDLRKYSEYLQDSYDDDKKNELSEANYKAQKWENEGAA